MSPQIAIQNGLKLMENGFERHRVNLDPSSSQSQTSIVYRPIDKYMNVLPHLIGSNEWREKWHVGLLDPDKAATHAAEHQVEEPQEVAEPSSTHQHSRDSSLLAGSSLMASQDSLARSLSSAGEPSQSINRTDEIFDDDDQHSMFDTPNVPAMDAPLFFRPQQDSRKIVNLFDDEPPSLNPSPVLARKPVNLFDDYGSTDSLPIEEPKTKIEARQPQPPVDLFDDNEFDNYIKKMESNENIGKQIETKKPLQSPPSAQEAEQGIRKKLTEEIMKAQLRKVEPSKSSAVSLKAEPPKEIKKLEPAAHQAKTAEPLPQIKSVTIAPQPQSKLEPTKTKVVEKPQIKKVTNLFDDEDEEDDYFTDIMKQKTAIKPKDSQPSAAKPKLTSLFDDEDDENAFDDIFKPKQSAPVSLPVKPATEIIKKPTSLFDDDEDEVPQFTTKKPEPVIKKTSSLFDDDDSELFAKKSEPQAVLKHKSVIVTEPEKAEVATKVDEAKLDVEKKNIPTVDPPKDIVADIFADNPTKSSNEPQRYVEAANVSSEIIAENQMKPAEEEFPKAMESLDPTPEDEIPTYTGTDTTIESDFDLTTESIPKLHDKQLTNTPRSTLTQESTLEQNADDSLDAKDSSRIFETPSTSMSATLPYLDDEPPPDDDDSWETEDNYDESMPAFKPKAATYPVVPVFDDFPPEDDFVETKSDVPVFNWESEDDEGPLIETPKVVPEPLMPPIEKPKAIEKPDVSAGKPRASVPKPKVKLSLSESPVDQVKSQTDAGKLEPHANVPKPADEKAFDETDRSAVSGSVKSKLDIFMKKPGEAQAAKASKPTPGKLSSNLKINVGALMPGARLSREVVERPERIETDDDQQNVSVSGSSSVVVPSSIDPNNNSSLLDNQLAKSRAKIPVKRRPSTRRGRQENYQRTLSLHGTENEREEDLSKSSYLALPSQSTKNLSMSMFDDGDDDDDFLSSTSNEKPLSSGPIATPPPAEPLPKPVTTNKIAVFYDDEDDTRMMVEQRKLDEQKYKNDKKTLPAKLFDDKEKLVGPRKTQVVSNAAKVSTKLVSSVFYESDDDDLFGSKTAEPKNSVPKVETVKAEAPKLKIDKTGNVKPKPSSSLFDDAEDDDLFESLSKPAKAPVKKSSKLFESDDETEPITPAPTAKSLKPTKSLFGDEESDDDDLFSSKPKGKKTRFSSEKSVIIVSLFFQLHPTSHQH